MQKKISMEADDNDDGDDYEKQLMQMANCRLVEKLGGEVVQCNFLIELTFLNGFEKIKDYQKAALLQYWSSALVVI